MDKARHLIIVDLGVIEKRLVLLKYEVKLVVIIDYVRSFNCESRRV